MSRAFIVKVVPAAVEGAFTVEVDLLCIKCFYCESMTQRGGAAAYEVFILRGFSVQMFSINNCPLCLSAATLRRRACSRKSSS